MKTISSDSDGDSIKLQITNPRAKYAPLNLTDNVVMELSGHFYTAREIGELFSVSEQKVLELHGEAFRRGKLFHTLKPRILLDQMMTDIMNAGQSFADKGAEHLFNRACRLIEMKWKRVEGYDQPKPTEASPLAGLSDEELKAKLEAAGYIKKDSQ